ncbi:hypothetical protein G6F56_001227 [Rhizopus delemar]|nr:hypothetical protein G6F56_001227 [Rhizopus delemar]
MGRSNTQNNYPQPKRLKDKDGSTHSDQPSDTQGKVNSTNNTGFYVAIQGESSKPTHPPEISFISTASKPDPTPTSSSSTTKSLDATTKQVVTVKTTIKSIWKREFMQPLYDLVNTTNTIVTYTFAFSKYIFLKELTTSSDFILKEFVRKNVFIEVFLSLISRAGIRISGKVKNTTAKYRRLISQYQSSYFKDAAYTPLKLTNAQQIALYECTKIQTAYHNNIKAHFGNRLRTLVNKLCEKKKRADTVRKEMISEGSGEKKIKEAVHKRVYNLCNQVRLAVERNGILPEVDVLNDKSRSLLRDLLSVYPRDYKFQKNSIFCDVKVRPENHLEALYKIAELFESEHLKQFIVFHYERHLSLVT